MSRKRGLWRRFSMMLATASAEIVLLFLLYLVALTQKKDLWALMDLLIIPSVLAGIAFLFNSAQRKAEHEIELADKKWQLWKIHLSAMTVLIHSLLDLGSTLGTVKFDADAGDYDPDSETAILEAMKRHAKSLLSPDIILVIGEFSQFESIVREAQEASRKISETFNNIKTTIRKGEWKLDEWATELRMLGNTEIELAQKFNLALAKSEDALMPQSMSHIQ